MDKELELGTTYRSAVNWLVGLAVSAIAGATSLHWDSTLQRAATGCFAVTVLSGVMLQFWDIRAQSAIDWLRAKVSEHSTVAILQPLSVQGLQDEFRRARRLRDGYHYIALTAFVLGVCLTLVSLVRSQTPAPIEPSPQCSTPHSNEIICADWTEKGGVHVRVIWTKPASNSHSTIER